MRPGERAHAAPTIVRHRSRFIHRADRNDPNIGDAVPRRQKRDPVPPRRELRPMPRRFAKEVRPRDRSWRAGLRHGRARAGPVAPGDGSREPQGG
jgi:hypothetical protein